MNCSDLKPRIYGYLGYRSITPDNEIDGLIDRCLNELRAIGGFRAVHKIFSEPPEFIKAPPYGRVINGCSGIVIEVTTLGHETDRRIRLLSRTDITQSAVFDCCASALLEYESDCYESRFGKRTSRFCFGYGGSSVNDLRAVFDLLQPQKIGITLTDSCFMLPSKSMAGIVGLGKTARKECGDCIIKDTCKYLKEGGRCYR